MIGIGEPIHYFHFSYLLQRVTGTSLDNLVSAGSMFKLGEGKCSYIPFSKLIIR